MIALSLSVCVCVCVCDHKTNWGGADALVNSLRCECVRELWKKWREGMDMKIRVADEVRLTMYGKGGGGQNAPSEGG